MCCKCLFQVISPFLFSLYFSLKYIILKVIFSYREIFTASYFCFRRFSIHIKKRWFILFLKDSVYSKMKILVLFKFIVTHLSLIYVLYIVRQKNLYTIYLLYIHISKIKSYFIAHFSSFRTSPIHVFNKYRYIKCLEFR